VGRGREEEGMKSLEEKNKESEEKRRSLKRRG